MASSRQRKSKNEAKTSSTPARTVEKPPSLRNTTKISFCYRFLIYLFVVALTVFGMVYFYGFNILSYFLDENIDYPPLKWWQTSVIYQIYPRSFQDSDGDGIGDLQGVTERLTYLKELGVGAIWLSPFYTSPMVDFGYDVSNFIEVDPIFGNMNDFENLVEAAHNKDLKVILDIIPNHSSNKHPWFIESSKSRNNPFSNFYVWKDGKVLENGTRVPPNNWVGCFHIPMWTWNEKRQQYYMHQFTPEQPDLNFREPRVREEMLKVFDFWLGKNVDGFRIDAIRHAFEDELLRDEPTSGLDNTLPTDYEYYNHIYTTNQMPETQDLIRSWRNHFNEYERKTGKNEIFMMVEVFSHDPDETTPYYHSGADFPFNMNLQALNRTFDALTIYRMVDSWIRRVPRGKWSNWVLGSHDTNRISKKVGVNAVNAMNMLLLTLPGTPVTYYGEEIGMRDGSVSWEDTRDPPALNAGPERYHLFSRDPVRTPMQWNAEKHAGFSKGDKTWLPVHKEYERHNVQAQLHDPSGNSALQLYRNLTRLRRFPSFTHGSFDYNVINKNIFSYFRYAPGSPAYLIAFNFGSSSVTTDFTYYKGQLVRRGRFVPEKGYVVHNTGNIEYDYLAPLSLVPMKFVTLSPGEGVVIRFWPDA